MLKLTRVSLPLGNEVTSVVLRCAYTYKYIMIQKLCFSFHVSTPGKSGTFSFLTASRPALWPTQPPIQWVLGGSYPRGKVAGGEADQSPPSSAEVKDA
jgi:hypothetical protein